MDGYIFDLRKKYGHPTPKKPQYSQHKHRPINYGAKQQMVQPEDTSPCLDGKVINRVQGIVGELLYVGIAVNKKTPCSIEYNRIPTSSLNCRKIISNRATT